MAGKKKANALQYLLQLKFFYRVMINYFESEVKGLCILWTASNQSSNFLPRLFDMNANCHFPIFYTIPIVFNQLTHTLQCLVYS